MIDKVRVASLSQMWTLCLQVLIITKGRRETFMEHVFLSWMSFNPDDSVQSRYIALHHRWGREELTCLQDPLINNRARIFILVPGLCDFKAQTCSLHTHCPAASVESDSGLLVSAESSLGRALCECPQSDSLPGTAVSTVPLGDAKGLGHHGTSALKWEMAFTSSLWTKEEFILWTTLDYIETTQVCMNNVICGFPSEKRGPKIHM